MKLLTLDQSTRTGWCVGDDALADPRSPGLEFGSFRMPKRDDPGERLVIFRDGLTEVIEKYGPEVVAYETPFFPVGGQAAAKKVEGKGGAAFSIKTIKFLHNLEGVLIETTARHGIVTQHFPSSSWRVTALGMGRLPFGSEDNFKDLMKKRAKSLGYIVRDDNESDAIGMMLHMLYGAPAAERKQGDLLSMEASKL